MENLLISSHDVISSINSSSMAGQNSSGTLGSEIHSDNNGHDITFSVGNDRSNIISSPNLSPKSSPRTSAIQLDYLKERIDLNSVSPKESKLSNLVLI